MEASQENPGDFDSTLKEAFNCPQELLDQHDVIELLEESQDPSVIVERR